MNMDELFLKVCNMSITASYVVLVLLVIRLFLRKAPKKYSYVLWSIALFRFICPVSFSSVFSLFQLEPFDMTVAQRGSGAGLNYIPENIGLMTTPKVTVGIPAMNAALSESLPAPVPYASANPMQIWIFIGSSIWLMGILILLTYNFVAYIRLRNSMEMAVLWEENVYECDKICSPFLLGFIHPKIYIPFGLGEVERKYVLMHERYHLKRKDYFIKLFSFLVLTCHWFNPLAWLAYRLMIKDMEMSCDEKVLSEEGAGIAYGYSMSLLSFAANRRYLAEGPLFFGEIGIRQRIKNVLKFQKPQRWVSVFAVILCIMTTVVCAANPVQQIKKGMRGGEITGNYIFEEGVYMNPLSSFMPFKDFKEYYTLTPDSLIVTDENGYQRKFAVSYNKDEVDEKEFESLFSIKFSNIPDISAYKKRYQYALTDLSGARNYGIYQMDDEIWLASFYNHAGDAKQGEGLWSIYKIKSFDGEIPLSVSIRGKTDGVEEFQALQKGFQSQYVNDLCYNITPEFIEENSDYRIFKYNTSCASYLLYEGEIYPLGEWFGGLGITSMVLNDLNQDGKCELYFTYSWGSGIHSSHAAYFDPAVKQVVTFSYSHQNSDMLVANNDKGGISLYHAVVSTMDDFSNFDLKGEKRILNIVYKNNEIRLDSF